MATCPCNPEKNFDDCCGPYLSGAATAPTAEALMRSRYSAYVRGNFSYLTNTWHPSSRGSAPDFGAMAGIRWTGLQIVQIEFGGQDDREGMVEFIVSYQKSGKELFLHEKSRFSRENGCWFYVDGDFVRQQPARTTKIGRNEPCPCGSGRKYKKCCWAQ